MGLVNRTPAVCSVLEGAKFQQLAGLDLAKRSGPARSTTTTYLYRRSTDWRGAEEEAARDDSEAPSAPPLDEARALQVLGLSAGATRDDILNAYRRLMQKLHPDRGGTDYLAATLNQAKEILLNAL